MLHTTGHSERSEGTEQSDIVIHGIERDIIVERMDPSLRSG
jgi:hypothetical protein